MIESKILSQYSPVRALHIHPRHYTILIEVQNVLFYYDCYASLELWSIKIEGELLTMAFSLDFDKVYALQGKEIAVINQGVLERICSIAIQNPDTFLLNELYYIFIKDDDIHLQKRINNQVGYIKLRTKYQKFLFLQESKGSELYWIAQSQQKLEFLKIDLINQQIETLSEYQIQSGTIKFSKQDEVYKKVCILVDEQITILTYEGYKFKFVSSSNYDRQIRDIAFFTFAENTDSVGGKYKIEHLLILSQDGDAVDLFELQSKVIKATFKLKSPISRIYFNRLFDNSFIALTPNGEVLRINIFGYDKEWVCLGFKFVEVQCNEIYEQKEDDFEVSTQQKRSVLTKEDLDDYSLSIFSADELLEGKVKRLRFEI